MECSDCGFVFTSPRLSDEALTKIYSDEYYENSDSYAAQQIDSPSFDHFELARRAGRLLKHVPGRPASVDVGCGGGRLVEAFSAAGFSASGIEPSLGTVQAARAAGRDVTDSDVSELPSESFDCVTSMHVLEHVTSPSEFTSHLYRITRPGGLCVIEVPNFASKAAQQQGANWYALHPATHLSHFTPGSLAGCLTKAGFSVRSLHRLGGAGVFSAVSESTVRKETPASTAQNSERTTIRGKALRTLWQLRRSVIGIPAVRRLARWVNWELLGHGEFVRAFAVKPRNAKAGRNSEQQRRTES